MNKNFFVLMSLVISNAAYCQQFAHPIAVQNTKWFRVVSPSGSDLKDLSRPMYVKNGAMFGIQTRVPYPGKPYAWHEDDQWQLVAYPIASLMLEVENSQISEKNGNDMFKWWAFRAKETGTFEIVLKRYDQEVVIPIVVE